MDDPVAFLQSLIKTPSFSKEEDRTAELIADLLKKNNVKIQRLGNNVIAKNKYFHPDLPTLLLNSHHDTVKPNSGYTFDPFGGTLDNGKILGLGSNDAGASLVALLFAFLKLWNEKQLPVNMVMIASAEEEISGTNGVQKALSELNDMNFSYGIIGEPTDLKAAVAEKGLMVLDCYSYGESGHAAREEGENALYKAIRDIEWFRTFNFPKVSGYLGPVKMTVTVIESGNQHNVVPDLCHFIVDVRSTDKYSNEELVEIIKDHVRCEVRPRSTRLNPSFLPEESSLFEAINNLGIKTFGSPTLSDQALMPFPTCKIGPGLSERSHSANEFIWVDELERGIVFYENLIRELISIEKQKLQQ